MYLKLTALFTLQLLAAVTLMAGDVDYSKLNAAPATIDKKAVGPTILTKAYYSFSEKHFSYRKVLKAMMGDSDIYVGSLLFSGIKDRLREKGGKSYPYKKSKEFLKKTTDLYHQIKKAIKDNGGSALDNDNATQTTLDMLHSFSEDDLKKYFLNYSDPDFLSKKRIGDIILQADPSAFDDTFKNTLTFNQPDFYTLDRGYWNFINDPATAPDQDDFINLFYIPAEQASTLTIYTDSKKDKINLTLQKYSHKGESYILALDGKKSDAIMGIIKRCDTNSTCNVDYDVWSNFSKTSKRDLKEDIEKAILKIKSDDDYLTYFLPPKKGSIPPTDGSIDTDQGLLKYLINYDKKTYGYRAKKIVTKPNTETEFGVTYKFDKDIKLFPKEVIYIMIPKRLRQFAIANIIFGHAQKKKDPDQRGSMSWDGVTKIKDPYPGLTSAQVHNFLDKSASAWHYWGGHASGKMGAKFAEIKGKSLEYDNLYEWPLKGYKTVGMWKHRKIKGLLHGDVIKLVSLGVDPVHVNNIMLKMIPPKSDIYDEYSFTDTKTSIGHHYTMKGRKMGGGQHGFGGKYPGAIRIDDKDYSRESLKDGMTHKKNKLFIPLRVGKKFTVIDIACGDTKPDGKINKDGGTGSPGGGKISVIFYKKSSKEEIILLKKENVSPGGVTGAFTMDKNYVVQKGDKLIIKNNGSPVYLMGLRIGYNN